MLGTVNTRRCAPPTARLSGIDGARATPTCPLPDSRLLPHYGRWRSQMTHLIVGEFTQWARGQGLNHVRAEVRIEPLGIPHTPKPLPQGWQGVYCFMYREAWLKVGKAGPKSALRWTSHHYHPGRAQSTLAFSLLRYSRFSEIDFPEVPDLKVRLQTVAADDLGGLDPTEHGPGELADQSGTRVSCFWRVA